MKTTKDKTMDKTMTEKDTSTIAQLVIANIKLRSDSGGCTCTNKPGDEYYCSVHGGEGSWIDLKVKSDMLIEKLGDWIVNQSPEIKRSAANAFGNELKTLGQTLSKVTI